jgi:hypothetical protein
VTPRELVMNSFGNIRGSPCHPPEVDCSSHAVPRWTIALPSPSISPAAPIRPETLRPGGLNQIPEWVPDSVSVDEARSGRDRNDPSRSGGPEVEPGIRPEPVHLSEVSPRCPCSP